MIRTIRTSKLVYIRICKFALVLSELSHIITQNKRNMWFLSKMGTSTLMQLNQVLPYYAARCIILQIRDC